MMTIARPNASSITSTSSHDSNQELISKKPEDFKLVGFDQPANTVLNRFQLPELSAQNALYAANFANSMAGDIIEKMSPLEHNTNLGVLGVSCLITGAAQVRDFYAQHKRIQELQIALIRALPTKAIIATQPACKKTNNNAFDLENMIEIMNKTGKIEIQMKESIKFTLEYNSFWTINKAGGAILSMGASITGAAVYILNQWNNNIDPNNPNVNLTLSQADQAALIAAGIPVIAVYQKINELLFNENKKLFSIIREIIQIFYVATNKIDKIPNNLLLVAESFMSDENIDANRRTITAFKEFKAAIENDKKNKHIANMALEIAQIKNAATANVAQSVVINVAPPAPLLPAKISSASSQSSQRSNTPKSRCVIC